METPLISVIVPVYNTKPYLTRCVGSICAQTYKNLEILLIDDGSTDGSGSLCEELAQKDDRIVVFHKENGGSSSARNLGLERAKGDYIGFIDSDDYISPEMYERLYEGIQAYGTSVCQTGRDEIDEQGVRLPDICVPPAEPETVSHRDFLRELLLHRGDCSFCTKLFRRELLEGKRFPEGALNEDFHFLVQLLPQIERLTLLPGQTYHVFYRMGSNSRKKEKENFSRVFEDNIKNADMVLGQIPPSDKELVRIARRFGIFQRIDYLLHIPVSRMTKENRFYRGVVRNLRKNYLSGLFNPYLTFKNKVYMTLFVVAPKGVRKVHKRIRRL